MLGIPYRCRQRGAEGVKPSMMEALLKYASWLVYYIVWTLTLWPRKSNKKFAHSLPFELCGPEIGPLVAVHLTAKRGSHKFQKYGQKRRLLRYRQIILFAVPESYFSAEFRSVPFRASEWALPRNSEFLRNEHFFPRNNGIRSEAIPRNFFGTKFRGQPYYTLYCICVYSILIHTRGARVEPERR